MYLLLLLTYTLHLLSDFEETCSITRGENEEVSSYVAVCVLLMLSVTFVAQIVTVLPGYLP